MNSIHFRSLDLNLFKVLLALMEKRSVTAAAADLSLTPSAVSHALRRLRASLNDPLFERRAGGLAPTPYALEVAKRAAPAIDRLRRATEPLDFDPCTSERRFVLAGGVYPVAVLLPRLLVRLSTAAPLVSVRFVSAATNFADDLAHGRIDIAFVAPVPNPQFEWMPLLQDEMVWAARQDHPIVKARLTMAMLKRARHVVVEPVRNLLDQYEEARSLLDEAADLHNAYDDALEGAAGRTATIVADPSHALAIVCGSDAVTLTSRQFAESMAPRALQLLTPPHATPPLPFGTMALRTRDAGVDWLLRQMSAAIAEVE